jgi:hypothetical protein
MMLLRVRVRTVDLYGFTGRDHHPKPEHVGMEGWITNLELEPEEEPAEWRGKKYLEYPEALRDGTQVFFVVLDNGDKLEFIGHEIELVSAVHDGDL